MKEFTDKIMRVIEDKYDFKCDGGSLKNCVDWERLHNSIKAERQELTEFLKKHGVISIKELELYISRLKTIAKSGAKIYDNNQKIKAKNRLLATFLDKQEEQLKQLKEELKGESENE